MRPVRVSLTAFGPYGGTQVVDFEELGDRSFFLIHGPTGAGKTSILDGITFALYGESSGKGRDGKELRSHHAEPDATTEVTFDFRVGRELYRVTRRPAQERQKKRGSGTTSIQPHADLWRRTGCTRPEEEGEVLATGERKVTERVQELLGFRVDEFRQVILLPQGKFQAFLLGQTQERQKILDVLFDTGVYLRIQERLKNRKKELETAARDLSLQRWLILREAEAENEEALAARITEVAARQAELVKAVATRQAAEKAAARLLDEARRADEKLRARADAEAALLELEGQNDAVARKTAELTTARAAAGLVDVVAAWETRRNEAAEAAKRRDMTAEGLATAKTALAAAEETLRIETAREPERDEARREAMRLEALVAKAADLAKAKGALAEARSRAAAATTAVETQRAAVDAGEKESVRLRGEMERARDAAGQVEARELAAGAAAKMREDAEALAGLRVDLEKREKSAAKAKQQVEARDRELARAREKHGALEAAWRRGQAAVLAGTLTEGEPCPVCGSTAHPHPAQRAEGHVDEAALDAQREEVQGCEEAAAKARDALATANNARDVARANAESLAKALGAQAEKAVEELAAAETEAKRLLVEAQDARSRAEDLKAALAANDTKLAAAKQDLVAADKTFTRVNGEEAAAVARVAERAADVPEALRAAGAAESAAAKAKEHLKAMETALHAAQEREQGARVAHVTAETDAANAERAAVETAKRETGARADLERRFGAAGFTNTAAWESARRAPEIMDALDAVIRGHEKALAAAQKEVERARMAADGLVAADLAAREAEAEVAARAARDALTEAAREETALGDLRGKSARLAKMNEEARDLDRRYEIIGRLAEVADGDNPLRLTFQRFVQAALLDDVLRVASVRLRRMSRNRFQLERAREAGDKRSLGGLDLTVFDEHTGTSRPVSSLSGGESFLAALSLALGLADVVQEYSGGIRMDTIFVDEGFGSLDPESLDLALRTLQDLQQGGRLVGIISHVETLKEQIDARLEVIPGRNGSSARFAVG